MHIHSKNVTHTLPHNSLKIAQRYSNAQMDVQVGSWNLQHIVKHVPVC